MNNSTRPIESEKYQQVMQLLAEGYKICEISKITGINRSSISNWKLRNGRQSSISHIHHSISDIDPIPDIIDMLGSFSAQDRLDYSYLLGLYIGDGCIYELKKTCKLTITLDKRYDSLNEYTCEVFSRFFNKSPYVFDRSTCGRGNAIDIIHHSKKLPYFFPQHGRGRKHNRPIILTKWQTDIVDPVSILKGLIMSDGSIYFDRQSNDTKINFTNKSHDIIGIFEKYLSLIGISFKTYVKSKTNIKMTTIHKISDVDKLISLIGTKDSIK